MQLTIDEYAHLDSPVHRWEPRTKLVALMALIFAAASVNDVRLLPALLLVTMLVYAISRLPLSFLLARLHYPCMALFLMMLVLPFLAGQTILVQIGPLALREEGLLALLLIGTRFVSLLTLGLVLFGTAPFLTMLKAMRALGLPSLLTDMTLFFYRYLVDMADTLTTMQTAMRLRGFRAYELSRRNLTILAALAGSVLIRSYDQSERVYKAMVLRGYGQAPRSAEVRPIGHYDIVGLAFTLLVAAGLIAAGWVV